MELTLNQLKEIAIKLNFKHSPNIGEATLKEKLIIECEEQGTTLEEIAKDLKFIEISENVDEMLENVSDTVEPKQKTEFELMIEKLSNTSFSGIEADKSKKDEDVATKEAMKLIRVTITSNNKNKSEYPGEVFTVRNARLPEIRKYVPYGVKWCIPKIMLNMIQEKKCQIFRSVKTNYGITTKKSHMIPEYNIMIHNPITKEEIEAIAKKQLAEGFNGE